MTIQAGALRELHLLHQQLRESRSQLDRGPKQLEARRQNLAKRKTELENAAAMVKRLRMSADQKDLRLKENEEKIAKLRRQLNEAKTNKEYQVLRDQVDADTMACSVLEDEILEKEAEAQKAEAELQEFERALGDSEKRLKDDLAMLERSLTSAEKALPAEVMAEYRRLVATRGADAMASVDGNVCSGCFTSVTPQMHVELRMDQLVPCKSCGRLLYLPNPTQSGG
jgi:predicted  nucleic acid-binding Zn-ribbon protein